MQIFQTIILSLVEGVTEFLPISSTGHLILASKLMGITQTEFVKSFEIAIQLGAILAVIALYCQKLWLNKGLWLKIATAFAPTGVIGFLTYKLIKGTFFDSPMLVVTSLFVGGFVILFGEKPLEVRGQKNKFNNLESLTYKQAFTIGVLQSISVVPGVSRALATIFGGLLVGLNKQSATLFSFYLAIPTMLAATGYDLIKSQLYFTPSDYQLLLIGFLGAFITALIAIKWLLGYVQKHSFRGFAIYRLLLAVIFGILLI